MTIERDFSRQSFLGHDAENIFSMTRVAIVGLGGGGSHIAQQLAHIGVGHFRLIDPDVIESSNLNRLVGATQEDVEFGRPKVEIARRNILGVRPWAEVNVAQKKWQDADDLIKDAHVIFGCVDGYSQRDYLEGAARRNLIPYIDIGMDVVKISENDYAIAGQMVMTRPGGPCMKCLGFITDSLLNDEENRYGDAGINPQVVWSNGTLASLAVGAFVKLFTPWFSITEEYTWLELNGNNQTIAASRRPQYMPSVTSCPHYHDKNMLGDPFFSLTKPRP
jgi:molybdopterin/thiamine biosynthesis adenylyltransferase